MNKPEPECTIQLPRYIPHNISPLGFDLETLIKGLKIMAEVVKLHGDTYLPLFIRVHREIEKRKKVVSYRDIALQIAANDL